MSEEFTDDDIKAVISIHNSVYASDEIRASFKEYDRQTKQVFLYVAEDFDWDEYHYLQNLIGDNLSTNILVAIIKNDRLKNKTASNKMGIFDSIFKKMETAIKENECERSSLSIKEELDKSEDSEYNRAVLLDYLRGRKENLWKANNKYFKMPLKEFKLPYIEKLECTPLASCFDFGTVVVAGGFVLKDLMGLNKIFEERFENRADQYLYHHSYDIDFFVLDNNKEYYKCMNFVAKFCGAYVDSDSEERIEHYLKGYQLDHPVINLYPSRRIFKHQTFYQFISPEFRKKVPRDVYDLLECFDFNVSQFAVDQEYLYTTWAGINGLIYKQMSHSEDLDQNNLSFARMRKYKKYGFSMSGPLYESYKKLNMTPNFTRKSNFDGFPWKRANKNKLLF